METITTDKSLTTDNHSKIATITDPDGEIITMVITMLDKTVATTLGHIEITI